MPKSLTKLLTVAFCSCSLGKNVRILAKNDKLWPLLVLFKSSPCKQNRQLWSRCRYPWCVRSANTITFNTLYLLLPLPSCRAQAQWSDWTMFVTYCSSVVTSLLLRICFIGKNSRCTSEWQKTFEGHNDETLAF